MKATLIIDMPKGCIDCPCHDTELLYCKTMEQHAEYFYEKPSWCPLKELPEKKNHKWCCVTDEEYYIGLGWDKCIDEILGEQDADI